MGLRHRWLTHAAIIAAPLFFAGHFSQAQVAQVAAGSIPPGQARIWFYRDYEPFVSRNFASVDLNGARVASLPPASGPVYRDVAPGHYRITPESWGTDINQSKEVDLAPGQEGLRQDPCRQQLGVVRRPDVFRARHLLYPADAGRVGAGANLQQPIAAARQKFSRLSTSLS
jgi:hypothetical protein